MLDVNDYSTSGAPTRGVLIESDVAKAVSIQKLAAACNAEIRSYPTADTAFRDIQSDPPEFLLVNLDRGALDLVRRVRREYPAVTLLAILPTGSGETAKRQMLDSGVSDFFIEPLCVEEFRMRLRDVTARIDRVNPMHDPLVHEEEMRNAIGEILIREYETLHVLGKASEYKDQETGSHIQRVAAYSKLVAEVIGESPENQDLIYYASALHDIGKIGIPDSILLKPGPLDDTESSIMKQHATNGHGILERAQSPYLLTGAVISLTHHERYDGTGYPMKLAKEEIPLFGRIVCVADVFDALTTRRPYKAAWSLDRAFALIESEGGDQFDPGLSEAFVSNEPRIREIYRDCADETDISPANL